MKSSIDIKEIKNVIRFSCPADIIKADNMRYWSVLKDVFTLL